MIPSGIYKITNSINGKFYVGSAVNLKKRFGHHYGYLKRGNHCNRKLQRSWNKHGSSVFEFSVLELVPLLDDLINREQYWIDALDAVNLGYNMSPTAGNKMGMRHSSETRKKMSESSLGKKMSEESRRKMSLAKTGSKLSAETREKMSKARKGRIVSEEHRRNLSIANKGRKLSPEHIEKMAQSRLGKKATEETKIRMSIAMTGKKHTQETKDKISLTKKLRKIIYE